VIPLWLTALVVSTPARLVVGVHHPDLRQASAQPKVDRLVHDIDATLVHRLSFALVLDVADREEALARLWARPDVAWAEEDVVIPVALRAVPDDPLYDQQWALHPTATSVPEATLDLEPIWDLTRGSGVRVAVIDDGFDLDHEDLAANMGAGRDLIADPPDNDASAGSGDLHGTLTAGVIAARGFNGIGITGACPECEIVPVRLIAGGGPPDMYTTGATVAAAIEWAVDAGAAVINNSWGPPDGNRFDPFHAVDTWVLPLPAAVDGALRYAAREGRGGLGTVVVWSAGNGNELVTYDGFAADPRVITTGSIDTRGVRAYYSDFGPPLDLMAPSSGLNLPGLHTTDVTGDPGEVVGNYFDDYGGTSASAALVSAAAALVIAEYPGLTAAQVMEALFDGAEPIDPARAQYANGHSRLYGHGRVDVAGALAAAARYGDEYTLWLEVCGNDIDDDGDSDIDEDCAQCIPDRSHEVCDGRDNNCDGWVDEYFVCDDIDRPVCAPCANSSECAFGSRCRAANDFPGTWCFEECAAGTCPTGFVCNGEVCVLVPAPDALDCFDLLRFERCDGLDNDDNGVIDDVGTDSPEARAATDTCGTEGVCAASRAFCVAGRWLCERVELWQEIESRCDGLDNDCDGLVDEHPLCAARELRLDPPPDDYGCGAVTTGAWVALLLTRRRIRRRQR